MGYNSKPTGTYLDDPEDEELGDEMEVEVDLAGGPRKRLTMREVIEQLSKPIEARYLSIKEMEGQKLPYISWHMASLMLDNITGGDWDWSLEEPQVIRIDELVTKGFVVVRGSLSITAMDMGKMRDGMGNAVLVTVKEAEGKRRFGDPFSNAESMAYRRAAAKFGLGRYLYNKDRAEAAVREIQALRGARPVQVNPSRPAYYTNDRTPAPYKPAQSQYGQSSNQDRYTPRGRG